MSRLAGWLAGYLACRRGMFIAGILLHVVVLVVLMLRADRYHLSRYVLVDTVGMAQ